MSLVLNNGAQIINTETYYGWLELPLVGTNFHVLKPVQATEVLL